jgi:hypothetical protein
MNIHTKLFVYLFLTFIGFTVIGTVSHELGHFAVAKYLGYNAEINYGETHWSYKDDSTGNFMSTTWANYRNQIKQDLDFPGKERYLSIRAQHAKDAPWITLGGPLQTMLTGSIGLLFLCLGFKQKEHAEWLPIKLWGLIFLSLFWLRQTANLVMFCIPYFIKGEFSMRGDEARLSWDMKLPVWTLDVVTGTCGAIVLVFIVFNILPKHIRFTFLLAGLFGGVAGYILWLKTMGPIIMP